MEFWGGLLIGCGIGTLVGWLVCAWTLDQKRQGFPRSRRWHR